MYTVFYLLHLLHLLLHLVLPRPVDAGVGAVEVGYAEAGSFQENSGYMVLQ